jgi:hypothetical protein
MLGNYQVATRLEASRVVLGSIELVRYAPLREKRNAYRLLVGKPEGKRPLGRPRRRCVDNIKMDLLEKIWGGVDWIGLAQDRDK